MPTDIQQSCSFCGKAAREAGKLITGPGVQICSECVQLCNSILAADAVDTGDAAPLNRKPMQVPKPHEIKALLDEHVIGQDRAKKLLSVAVYNHYKRINSRRDVRRERPYADVELEKSNILLIGSTGTGKTLLAKTLARILDVPFSIADATNVTEAGYVGEDVENILLRLYQAADYDVERTEMGIIYIDEIDKIGRRMENVSITRDVSGEGVQQALLKILEGTVANIPPKGGRKHPQQEYVRINTEHILFICGGAFVGLEELIKARHGKGSLGYHGLESKRGGLREGVVEPEDLLKFGLIPEFIGRLPVIGTLDPLSEEDLIRILTEPRNAMVKQYAKLMSMEDVQLSFDDDALKEMARMAYKKETGARGLRTIIEQIMLDIMYDIPARREISEYRVDRELVLRHTDPVELEDERQIA